MVDLSKYVEVKDRIRLFYEQYPDGRLTTHEVRISVDDDTPRVLVHAKAYRTPDDPLPTDGWSWMVLPGTTNFTRGSEIENTETSAWGRAIGALGIGIAGSIASANEVANKEGADRPIGQHDTPPARPPLERRENGLIGVVAVSGQSDAQLRETPDGWVFPFRLKDGAKAGIICQAHDAMAQALANITDLVGQRVEVWGKYSDETFEKAGKTIGFKVLHVERIQTPDWILPAAVEAESVPLFDEFPEFQ
jgi:hypothetical protein